jgi:hypothetical protein
MPLAVIIGGVEEAAALSVHLELGVPTSRGGIDREVLRLELTCSAGTFVSAGRSGWFEHELLDLQGQLPTGSYLRACISCAFSDYSPYGSPMFGGLACFRDNKAAYRAVKTKGDLFSVWDTMTEFVQETYVCPEFERFIKETGYRG